MGMILLFVMWGGLLVGGWFPPLAHLFSLTTWLAIGAAVGMLGGVLFTTGKGPLYVGLISGPMASLGAFTLVWAVLRSVDSIPRLALVALC